MDYRRKVAKAIHKYMGRKTGNENAIANSL